MDTPYDWITVMIFAGLVVLFLQRSTSERDDGENDSVLKYLLAGVGCAVANYLGNHGSDLLAVLLLVGTLAYIFHWLKPFQRRSGP